MLAAGSSPSTFSESFSTFSDICREAALKGWPLELIWPSCLEARDACIRLPVGRPGLFESDIVGTFYLAILELEAKCVLAPSGTKDRNLV